jgi:hypothetical protein
MEFKKVYKCFIPILVCCLLLPFGAIAAGGNNFGTLGPLGSGNGQWKGDDFDSYPLGALAPPTNGWLSLNNKMWSIVYGVLAGKVLYFAPNDPDFFIHPSDASDYSISVQIKHSLIPTSNLNASLVGRFSGSSSYYSCYIYTNIDPNNNHTTRLALVKSWKTGSTTHGVFLKNIHCFQGDVNPDLYYTLSMKVKGCDITATLSVPLPSIPPFSVSYTDDGITDGPVLTGSYVGVHSDADIGFHPYFDNFTYDKLSITSSTWLPLLLEN